MKDELARAEDARGSVAAKPSDATFLDDCCTRCGLSMGRAMLGALALDTGGSSSFDPLACEGDDGVKREHDFQPRRAA